MDNVIIVIIIQCIHVYRLIHYYSHQCLLCYHGKRKCFKWYKIYI